MSVQAKLHFQKVYFLQFLVKSSILTTLLLCARITMNTSVFRFIQCLTHIKNVLV